MATSSQILDRWEDLLRKAPTKDRPEMMMEMAALMANNALLGPDPEVPVTDQGVEMWVEGLARQMNLLNLAMVDPEKQGRALAQAETWEEALAAVAEI